MERYLLHPDLRTGFLALAGHTGNKPILRIPSYSQFAFVGRDGILVYSCCIYSNWCLG